MSAAADELARLHTAPELLVLANVWDAASARAVAEVEGTRAIATASHAIAAAHGYPDGEHIPLELHLAAVERVVAAVEVPVTADLEAGYGDPGETTRRAIGLGVAGMNLEDTMRPLPEAVAAVEAVVAAREAEGTGFVLNARTDAYLLSAPDPLDEAIARGRAFIEAGAECVFVPGVRDAGDIEALVGALGRGRLSVIVAPGSPPVSHLERLGVARVSIGPFGQRVAMAALRDAAAALYGGGSLPG